MIGSARRDGVKAGAHLGVGSRIITHGRNAERGIGRHTSGVEQATENLEFLVHQRCGVVITGPGNQVLATVGIHGQGWRIRVKRGIAIRAHRRNTLLRVWHGAVGVDAAHVDFVLVVDEAIQVGVTLPGHEELPRDWVVDQLWRDGIVLGANGGVCLGIVTHGRNANRRAIAAAVGGEHLRQDFEFVVRKCSTGCGRNVRIVGAIDEHVATRCRVVGHFRIHCGVTGALNRIGFAFRTSDGDAERFIVDKVGCRCRTTDQPTPDLVFTINKRRGVVVAVPDNQELVGFRVVRH